MTTPRTSRRTLLAATLGGLALAGCQVDTGSSTTGASQAGDVITLPDLPDAVVPSSQISYRWCDSGDLKALFVGGTLKALTARYPTIATTYDGKGWDTVNQVVPLGIRNGSAHDAFQLPSTTTPQTAIEQGWVVPLDDILDVGRLTAQLPEGSFVPGIHVFDAKTYSYPLSSPKRLDMMAFYDLDVMKQAGVDDPVAQITSWDGLRAALRKVAATGKPGLMLESDRLNILIAALAQTMGWTGFANGLDYKTGRYAFSSDAFVEAYEFLRSLVTDDLVVKGFLNLVQRDSRAQMTSSVAGMIFNGPWDIPAWKRTAPDWRYAIAPVPPAVQGTDYHVPYQNSGGNGAFVYAKSPHHAITAALISYMTSPAGQKALVLTSGGLLQSMNPTSNAEAATSDLLDANAKRAAAIADQLLRQSPMVELRNPDAAKVTMERKPVTPGILEVLQGLFTGQLTDARAELAKVDAALDASLDAAIEAARAKGSTVTRDDYVFAGWDPTKDFTSADYRNL